MKVNVSLAEFQISKAPPEASTVPFESPSEANAISAPSIEAFTRLPVDGASSEQDKENP